MASTRVKRKRKQTGDVEEQIRENKKRNVTTDEKEIVDLFSHLPPEIIKQLLSNSNDHTKRTLRVVCKYWHDYINITSFRLGVLLASEAEQFTRCFNRRQTPFSLKFAKIDYLNDASPCPNLINQENLLAAVRSLTQLTALDLRLKKPYEVSTLTKLEALTILHPLQQSELLKLTNLKSLKAQKIVVDPKSLRQLPPNLESLDYEGHSRRPKFSAEIYPALTQLCIASADKEFFHAAPNLRRLVIYQHVSTELKLTAKDATILPNVEEIISGVDMPEIYSNHTRLTKLHANAALKLAQHVTQLKDIYCYNITSFAAQNLQSLHSCVINEYNKTLLQQLNADKIRVFGATILPTEIDLLYKFTNLEKLQLSVAEIDDVMEDVPKDDTPIHSFAKLTELKISCNALPMKLFERGTNLEKLKIDDVGSDISHFNLKLNHLTSLCIETNSLQDLSVKEMTNLIKLKICGSSEEQYIDGLSQLTNLTRLEFDNGGEESPSRLLKNWSDLRFLTNLLELTVHQEFNHGDINNLTTLRLLTQLHVWSSSDGLWCLTKLTRLQKVTLEGSEFESDPFDEERFLQHLPYCHQFEYSPKDE